MPIQLSVDIDSKRRKDRLGSNSPDNSESCDLERDDIDLFCKTIEPHLNRCNRLTLKAGDECQGQEILNILLSKPLPTLWSIQVHIPTWNSYNKLGCNQMSLTHAYLTGQPTLYSNFPLGHVTTLRLHLCAELHRDCLWGPADWDVVGKCLASLSFLTYLELNHPRHWPSRKRLTLPALRTLVCPVKFEEFPSLYDASEFLLALSAPLLEEMRLGYHDEVNWRLALFGRSKFPSLVRLCWMGDADSTTLWSVEQLSKAFPLLVQITWIAEDHYSLRFLLDNLCELFDDDDDDDDSNVVRLWPRLDTMGVAALRAGREDFPAAELQALIVRRSEMGCPIRTLLAPTADIIIMERAGLFSCTQPPVVMVELVADGSPFLDI